MAKADRFYFENFVQAADYSCKAANYLKDSITNYDPSNIQAMLKQMHEYEHAGDTKKHEMTAALAKAFVTPVDREDLALISQNLDEVTDRIEEVLERFYVDQITTVTPEALVFADKLVECCSLLQKVLVEFVNFKKPATLHQLIVELNHCEEECDKLYLEATLKIRQHSTDILEIISWREIYDCMEDCADACEHVADCVEMVVMKNT